MVPSLSCSTVTHRQNTRWEPPPCGESPVLLHHFATWQSPPPYWLPTRLRHPLANNQRHRAAFVGRRHHDAASRRIYEDSLSRYDAFPHVDAGRRTALFNPAARRASSTCRHGLHLCIERLVPPALNDLCLQRCHIFPWQHDLHLRTTRRIVLHIASHEMAGSISHRDSVELHILAAGSWY